MKKSTPAVSPDAYVEALDGWRRDVVAALRSGVRAASALDEAIKWGHLVYHDNGPVLLIRAEDHRVLFGFWRGQRLRGIEPRLKASGKYEMATLELREGMTVAPSTVRRLTRKAVSLNKTLGDPTHAAKPASKRRNASRSPRPAPAVARRSAEAELRGLIAKFAPAHQRLIGATRRWLRKRLPTAHEVVYEYKDFFVTSYSPSERGYEGVLAIRASANGVRLYFNRGKELPDPAKLLQGSGNQTRWIHLEGASTLARPAVARLINEAIARNRVPFARTGRGPVVIRSVSAKQRRRRRPA